jgi:hypothetical protein
VSNSTNEKPKAASAGPTHCERVSSNEAPGKTKSWSAIQVWNEVQCTVLHVDGLGSCTAGQVIDRGTMLKQRMCPILLPVNCIVPRWLGSLASRPPCVWRCWWLHLSYCAGSATPSNGCS